MERSHLCKQHHLECVNIPETVNNSIQLCFSFPFLRGILHEQTVNEREHNLVASKFHY